jgi:hypothetical protein
VKALSAMMTGDGPPARNTRSARGALRRARDTHSIPPRETQPIPVQSGLSDHPGIDVPRDEGPRGRTADISPVEDAKPEGGSVTNELFLFFSHFWHVFSDDSLVITHSCTITKLRLLMIQSLTDLIQTLTDAHSASLQIAY